MAEFLAELIRAATAADGQPPFSDQSLVELRNGTRKLISVGGDSGAALVASTNGVRDAELVVHPDARHRGLGLRLLQDVIEAAPGEKLSEVLIWAHGDHPDARALAAKHGFEPVRELLQLRMGLDTLAGARYSTSTKAVDTNATSTKAVRAFCPGVDDAAWLELNALAFADHPEQGKLTQPDLDARMAEAWFDPADFLLLQRDNQLVGSCWLKVEGSLGEFYAVGVHPERRGEGLGRTLVTAGLQRLAGRGILAASLYVEADNEAAVRLYRSFGFADHTIDIQYRLTR